MADALHHAISRNIERIVKKFRDKSYRDSYVRSHTCQFLSRQMRAFRGEQSQSDFAKLLGISQSVVSERLENPNYGKWNIQTLFDTASKLDVAVIVRFVDFPTFLKLTRDTSEIASRPGSYNEQALNDFVISEQNQGEALAAFNSRPPAQRPGLPAFTERPESTALTRQEEGPRAA